MSEIPEPEKPTKDPPWEGLPYEMDGDTRREFWITSQKETNLGVAQPYFDP